MTNLSTDPCVQLGGDLLQLIARFNRWTTQHADMRLPLAQARLLSLIEERGAARISELALAENCTQPGMTQQVQRLEAAAWVQRAPDPRDARAVLISLTEAGRELLQAVRRARAEAVAPIIEQLGDDARHDLQTALSSLSQLIDIAVVVAPAEEK